MKKKHVDKLIAMQREYWNDEYVTVKYIDAQLAKMSEYEKKFIKKPLLPLLSSVIGSLGIKPNAPDEDIYKILEVLGVEVEECDT